MKRLLLLCWTFFILGITVNAQTFFTDQFNAGTIGTGWIGNGAYGLKQAGGMLSVNVSSVQPKTTFTLNLGGVINISSTPYANIKLKGDKPYILKMILIDTANVKVSQDVRVPISGTDFVNYCFDFSAAALNKTQIAKIEFSVNYDVNGFKGMIYFEDLFIGTSATKFANLSGVADILDAETDTAQIFYVTDIKNASAIQISGGDAVIQNIVPSAIANGVCKVKYDAKAIGNAVITVTAVGTGGFGNNTTTFNLAIEGNLAPTINQPADAKIANGKKTLIKLSGITDGNASMDQVLTVTATSGTPATIPNPVVVYDQGSPYATLEVTPAAAGSSVITVTVKDNGTVNHTTTKTFNITSYDNFNYSPTLNIPANQGMYKNEPLKVKLTGISDGDGGTQTLTFTSVSKAGIVTITPITYVNGKDTATLSLSSSTLGKDTITITATDNGGGTSNGSQSVSVTFIVDVLAPAPKGYKVPMNDFAADLAAGLWKVEGLNVTQKASYVDTLGSKCLRLELFGKMDWTGTWYNFDKIPTELNVSEAPYISYEIMGKNLTVTGKGPSSLLLSHAYFWAVNDTSLNRNAGGAHQERDTNKTSEFKKMFFDFRGPGKLNSETGEPINTNRVVQLLINYHADKFLWPNTTISGTVYIRDIRIGDSCQNVPDVTPECTINNVPTIVLWAGAGTNTVKLSGISNGKGNTTGVTFTSFSGKTPYIPHPTVGALNPDGTATLTYNILTDLADSSKIVVNVLSNGSIEKRIEFYVKTVLDNPANAVAIHVDGKTTGQTIAGFGTANQVRESQLIPYAQEQGCTMMRLFGLTNFEMKNDNNDNNILDRSKLDYSDLDLDYIRKAYAAGVTDFYVTLLSPPAWMLLSLSCAAVEAAPQWSNTLQKVDPMYYDEYVEYMVAITRVIKEETGIELVAFCPQNEPAFTEPYPGAILDPVHMATVCGMLGKRLAAEGFKTKVINSEQVFGQGSNPVLAYINALKADPDGNQYTGIVGMHYPDANVNLWTQQYNACKNGTYPKELWATECQTNGNDYNAILAQSTYIITGLNNGLSAWTGLGYNGGSSGDDNTVTIKGGMMAANNKLKHFYAYKNFAKYIRKGAVQLKTTSSNPNVLAASVKHTGDTTMTIVLVNKDSKLPYAIRLTGSAPATGWTAYRTSFYEKCEQVYPFKNGLINLPPRSITTLIIKTNINHAPTIDPIADMSMNPGFGGAVNLTGIGCGDPVDQALSFTATSSDTTILKASVTYNATTNKGSLMLMPPQKEGVVTITLIIKDDAGRENGGIDADTISFKVSIVPSALDDVSEKVSVYPNPASDVITVVIPEGFAKSNLKISNMAGQVVSQKNLSGESQVELSVADLPAGTYILSISDNKNSVKAQFIKK